MDDALAVRGDQGATLAREHTDRLLIDQLAAQRIPRFGIGGGGDDAPLALGHHLAGDDDDVAVAQPGCGLGDGGAEIVTGPELGKSGDGKDLDSRGGSMVAAHHVMPASSSPARTISAVTSGADISNGIDLTVTPGTSA